MLLERRDNPKDNKLLIVFVLDNKFLCFESGWLSWSRHRSSARFKPVFHFANLFARTEKEAT